MRVADDPHRRKFVAPLKVPVLSSLHEASDMLDSLDRSRHLLGAHSRPRYFPADHRVRGVLGADKETQLSMQLDPTVHMHLIDRTE